MISKNKIAAIEKRRKVYHFILKYPGLHIRELSRDLDIPYSTLNHHLSYLKKQGIVSAKSDGKYIRYYVAGKVGATDEKLLNLMRHTVPRNIILLLFLFPVSDLSQIEIVRFARTWKKHWTKIGFHLNKHPTTIAFHLNKLVKMGIIESYQKGTETRYGLKDLDVVTDFLIIYEKNFSGPVFGHIINIMSGIFDDDVDNAIEALYDILPHPYHV